MKIIIVCDQKDCIFNKIEWEGAASISQVCKEPDGVIISTIKGCLSKKTKAGITVKEEAIVILGKAREFHL